jgi:hypothetical protein
MQTVDITNVERSCVSLLSRLALCITHDFLLGFEHVRTSRVLLRNKIAFGQTNDYDKQPVRGLCNSEFLHCINHLFMQGLNTSLTASLQ